MTFLPPQKNLRLHDDTIFLLLVSLSGRPALLQRLMASLLL